MSFLFADRRKQIAVVPTSGNNTGLLITGSVDLLNQASVAGLASATRVGNLTEAVLTDGFNTNRGSLTYYNGLVIEGLPHIALSPEMGNVTAGVRLNGIGVGLGFTESSGVRTYNKPSAVLDILGTNADVKITGGALSTAGTASLIMVGSKANPGAVSGFKIDVERTTTDPTLSVANMYIRPYNINTNLPALISMDHEGNVGIGTSSANSTLHVVSSQLSSSAVSIENSTGPGLTVKTNSGTPLRVITGYPLNETIALTVASNGILGVKMDSSTVSAAVASDLKIAMVVNGSVMATNTVFAFGTFSYANNIFVKKDTYNIDTITATPSWQVITWNIIFLQSLVGFDASTGYTVLVSDNSGQKLFPTVTIVDGSSFTIQFSDINGENIVSQAFSVAVFANTGSLYAEASLVQAVF